MVLTVRAVSGTLATGASLRIERGHAVLGGQGRTADLLASRQIAASAVTQRRRRKRVP